MTIDLAVGEVSTLLATGLALRYNPPITNFVYYNNRVEFKVGNTDVEILTVPAQDTIRDILDLQFEYYNVSGVVLRSNGTATATLTLS